MREVLGESLKSPNPDPQLIREFASSRVTLAPDALRRIAANRSHQMPVHPLHVVHRHS
jgi:hypothetical protein